MKFIEMQVKFKLSAPGSINEGKDLFSDVDVLKIDPDRADVYDVVQALMPTLVRMSYTYLIDDKTKYDRANHPDDEDYKPFEFDVNALEERLDDLVRSIRDKLEDLTAADRKAYINKVKSEFKEKLTEGVEDALHLAPKVSDKSKKFESKFQFDGYVQGQHGVPTKKRQGSKTYYFKGNKVAAVWDGLDNSGVVYEKGTA